MPTVFDAVGDTTMLILANYYFDEATFSRDNPFMQVMFYYIPTISYTLALIYGFYEIIHTMISLLSTDPFHNTYVIIGGLISLEWAFIGSTFPIGGSIWKYYIDN